MTKRENVTRIYKKQKGERLPFMPNFDHWLGVNNARGTMPAAYRGMSRNDIVRAVGGTIWARTYVLNHEMDPEIKVSVEKTGDRIITRYRTPVGEVYTMQQYAPDFTRALFLKEHWIKTVNDIKVVKFITEHTTYTLDPEPFIKSEEDVGDDGISLVGLPYCFPYINFGKNDCGWERGIYLFADYREQVEDLMEVYTHKTEEAAGLIARSPALVVNSGDNMDEWTTPPNVFKKYAIPYYNRIATILHGGGKIYKVHWCGRTEHLLSFVPECGIDIVEALTVKPMSTLTIPDALDMVGDNVVVQGGIPSVMMCQQGGSRDDLKRYVEELLNSVPHGYRYVVGMSDNVPPDADFPRVKIIADMVNSL